MIDEDKFNFDADLDPESALERNGYESGFGSGHEYFFEII